MSIARFPSHPKKVINLVGGFNPSPKYESNWTSSPSRDEHQNFFWNHHLVREHWNLKRWIPKNQFLGRQEFETFLVPKLGAKGLIHPILTQCPKTQANITPKGPTHLLIFFVWEENWVSLGVIMCLSFCMGKSGNILEFSWAKPT